MWLLLKKKRLHPVILRITFVAILKPILTNVDGNLNLLLVDRLKLHQYGSKNLKPGQLVLSG